MNGICFVPGRRLNETACASRSIARLGAALIATISLARVDMEKGLRPNSRSTSRHHRNFSGVRTLV